MDDPRRTISGNFKYPMAEILFLTLSGAICGLTDWKHIERFGYKELEWLRKYLPYENGVPSHHTIARFFNSLDPNTFSEYFAEWAKGLSEKSQITGNKTVAIDGKRVNSKNSIEEINIVSALCGENNICLGQSYTKDKSNEISAIPEVLDMIYLRDSVVTIDAIGCQHLIAEKINIEKKADYALAVKANQGKLMEDIMATFEAGKSLDCHISEKVTSKHVVKRTCELSTDLSRIRKKENWKGLSTLAKLTSLRTDKKSGEVTREVRYYISSLKKPKAEDFARHVRNHWAVENKLHWVLDVVFGEDSTAKREANGIKNFNTVKKAALNLLGRFDHLNKGRGEQVSKKSKMLLSLIDTNHREEMLGLDIL